MDHSHMGHGGMDHGDMDMGHSCNMNMLFTWDTKDLCIVFKQWHITGTASLIWSLLGIILLTAGYEAVREVSRRYESYERGKLRDEDGTRGRAPAWANVSQRKSKMVKAALYALQVFYSFFIMLLFMTYNGWVMLAVAVGAFVGYLIFGGSSATKTVACH